MLAQVMSRRTREALSLATAIALGTGAGVLAPESPAKALAIAGAPLVLLGVLRLLSERWARAMVLLGGLLIPFGARIPVTSDTSLDSALLLFQFGGMLALVVWLVRGLRFGRLSVLDLFVLGYTVLICLSIFAAVDHVLAVRQGYYLLNWTGIYFAVTRMFSAEQETNRLLRSVVWGMALLALVGLVQVALSVVIGVRPVYSAMIGLIRMVEGTSFNDALGIATNWITPYNTFRAIGTHNGPMSFGQAMIIGLFPAIGCSLMGIGRLGWIAWGLSALFAMGVVLCFSRGVWLAAAFGTLLACAMPGVLARRQRFHLIRVILIVGVGGAFLLMMFAPRLGEVIARTFAAAVSPETAETRWARSSEVRKDLYRIAGEAIAERPWLGWGPGNYGLAAGLDPSRANAHNVYLQIASEMGLLALCFYLLIVGETIYAGLLLAKNESAPWRRGVGFGLAIAFCALCIHGMFDTYLTSPKIAMHFWVAVALVEGMRRQQAKAAA